MFAIMTSSPPSQDDPVKEGKMLATFLLDTTGRALTGMKNQIPMLALKEPYRWKLEMIVALKENRPIDVFRIAGSHEFAEKDALTFHVFLQCATEMMEANGDLKLDVSDATTCSSSSPSPSSSSSVDFAQPDVLKLTPANTAALRVYLRNNGNKISKEVVAHFARRFKVSFSTVHKYCEFRIAKMDKAEKMQSETEEKMDEETNDQVSTYSFAV